MNLMSSFKPNDTIYIHVTRRDFTLSNFDSRTETFLLRYSKGNLLMTSRLQYFKYKAKTIKLTNEQIAFLKRLDIQRKKDENIYDEYNIIKLDTTSFTANRPTQFADTLKSFFIKK